MNEDSLEKDARIVPDKLNVQQSDALQMYQCLVDQTVAVSFDMEIRDSDSETPNMNVQQSSENFIRIQLTKGGLCS